MAAREDFLRNYVNSKALGIISWPPWKHPGALQRSAAQRFVTIVLWKMAQNNPFS
jgi:hypothetical protein